MLKLVDVCALQIVIRHFSRHRIQFINDFLQFLLKLFLFDFLDDFSHDGILLPFLFLFIDEMIHVLGFWESDLALVRAFIPLLFLLLLHVMIERVVCRILDPAKDVVVLAEIDLDF